MTIDPVRVNSFTGGKPIGFLLLGVLFMAAWLANMDPGAAASTAVVLALIYLGLADFRAMAAVSFLLVLILPEGDLLTSLGFSVPLGLGSLNVCDGILAANVGVFSGQFLLGRVRPVLAPSVLAVCSFAAASLLALVHGIVAAGFKEAYQDFRPLLFYSVVVMASAVVRDRNDVLAGLKLLVGGVAAHGVLLIALWIFQAQLIPPEMYRQLFDYDNSQGRLPFSNSGLAAAMLPSLLLFRRYIGALLVPRYFGLVILALLPPIAFSMSRAELGNLAMGLLVCWIVSLRHEGQAFLRTVRTLGVGLVLALLGMTAFPGSSVGSAVLARFTGESVEESGMGRLLSSLYAYQGFLEAPLAGLGYGSQLGLVWITGSVTDKYFVDDAWATTLAKQGLIGGGAFAAMLLVVFLTVVRTARDTRVPVHVRDMLLSLSFCALPMLVSFSLLTAFIVHSRVTIAAFCVLVAMLATYRRTIPRHA